MLGTPAQLLRHGVEYWALAKIKPQATLAGVYQ